MPTLRLKSANSSKHSAEELRSICKGIHRKTVGILGQKQSGKTFLLKEMLKVLPTPILCIDMVGRLMEYVESEPNLAYLVKVKDWSLELWNLVQQILRRREILVIYLDKGMSQPEKTEFMDKLATALSEYHRFVMVIDEIHEIIPQTTGERALSFERLIRTGANSEIGFVFTTQRPQIVTKDIFALIDILVCFRMVYGGDLEILKDILKYHMSSSAEIDSELRAIQGFGTGEHKVYQFVTDKSD